MPAFAATWVALALGGCGGGTLGGPPRPNGGGGGAGGSVTLTGTGNVAGAGAGATTGTGAVAGTGTGAAAGTGTGAVGGTGTGAGGSASGFFCGGIDPSLRRLTPEILLVVDRSAVMNLDAAGNDCGGDCGQSSRWARLTPAIDQIVDATSAKVEWGLKAFADSDGACGVGAGVAVPVGPSNAGLIAATLAGWSRASGSLQGTSQSPTRAAEDAAAAYLSALAGPDPKLIVLATTGSPDCGLAPMPTTQDDETGATKAVEAARDLGIPTLILGATGASSASATLTALAIAGAAPQSGPTPYSSTSAADLGNLVDAILAVASCSFALGQPSGGGVSNDYIAVFGDGARIPRDPSHASGWDYTDAIHDAIRIYGPTCDAIKDGVASVKVTYVCQI